MGLTIPRCELPSWGAWYTIVRVKKNREPLVFRHLFSNHKRYWHQDHPAHATVTGFCCLMWGKRRAWDSFHVLRKDGTTPNPSGASAELYFGTNTFPLSDPFQVHKILRYPFPLRGPSLPKASFPLPCHSTSFSVLWIHWDPFLCFLVTLNLSPLCPGNQQW